MKQKCDRNLDKMNNLDISQSSGTSIFKLKDYGTIWFWLKVLEVFFIFLPSFIWEFKYEIWNMKEFSG